MRNGAGHHHARLCNDPTDDNAIENWPRQSSLSLALFPFFFFIRVYTSREGQNILQNLHYVVTVKSTVEISQNFVAFSKYMNFTKMMPYFWKLAINPKLKIQKFPLVMMIF